MSSRTSAFILPNSTRCRTIDRFSDLPDDDGKIPFWPRLKHLLGAPISSITQLIDRVQTIAANAESCQDNDYGFLKLFLQEQDQSKMLDIIWPKIRDIALALPTYFPEGQLELLRPGCALHLSRGQVACLVVHQFMSSSMPQRNDEGYQDLSIWYSSEQRHPTAVQMYLEALSHDAVTYEIHLGEQASLVDVKLASVYMSYLDSHTSHTHKPEVQGKGGAVVVSANKVIGFGQSATQEEIFVGISPEACPVVLVAPHLTDGTVITVSGARAMVDMKGQRRDIEWAIRPSPYSIGDITSWKSLWQGGRLVLMDALEMDMFEQTPSGGLPDLYPENSDREIRKATNGFASYKGDSVFTGIWGCGAFGGDPGVKLMVLWLAAGAANVKLNLMLGPGEHNLGQKFEEVAKSCDGLAADEVRGLLLKTPRGIRREEILEWIAAAASGARRTII
ncbi:hypothetical protein ACHAPU_003863 [Fusarium lateritium]